MSNRMPAFEIWANCGLVLIGRAFKNVTVHSCVSAFLSGVYILVESLRPGIFHVTLRMSFRKATLLALGSIGLGALIGCSSAPQATRTSAAAPRPASAIEIEQIQKAMRMASVEAHTLYVEGDITFEHDGESNNASFVMRSKRRGDEGRIDSLSIEIKGPFGVKVARFLASPQGYQMYDILHGETLHGRTDARTLETITQMKGLSLAMMSDLAYGLAPETTQSSDDSIEITKISGNPLIELFHPSTNVTETLYLISSTSGTNYKLSDYYRFSGKPAVANDANSAEIRIHFAQHQVIQGFPVPKHIEVSAGTNKLVLDYTKIDLNPESLTVKIKMPSQ